MTNDESQTPAPYTPVTDTWTLDFTEEQLARQKSDPAYLNEMVQYSHDHGCVECAKAGYGILAESLCIAMQTTTYAATLSQKYRRAVVDESHIVLIGEPLLLEVSKMGLFEGRIFALYQPPT